jgi:hypothetical protein
VTARPPLPRDPEAGWTAEVEWRDGRFWVVGRRTDGSAAEVLAESAAVAWPPSGPAEVEALADAQRELERALTRVGWQPLGSDGPWYAARFAWAPVTPTAVVQAEPRTGPQLFAPIPAWPPESKRHWRCEITWDAGWIGSRFQAIGYRPGKRRGRPIGASRPVRGRAMGPPDPAQAEHRAAHEALVSALETAGWDRMGAGADWYSERLWWRRDGAPAERVEPPEPVR